MTRVAIFGAGGLGCLVHDTLRQAGLHAPAAFLDSDPARHNQTLQGLPILGGFEALPQLQAADITHAIVAIGDNETRIRIADALEAAGFQLVSAIHPSSATSNADGLGRHLIIGPRAILCVHTTIADHAVISAGAIIDHDNRIGRGAFVHPAVRLAGGVTVGAQAVIGIGAAVIPGRTIGPHATVAPGSVVIRDVPAHARVSGVPAQLKPAADARFVVAGAQVPAVAR